MKMERNPADRCRTWAPALVTLSPLHVVLLARYGATGPRAPTIHVPPLEEEVTTWGEEDAEADESEDAVVLDGEERFGSGRE